MGTETQKTVLKLPSNSAETSKPASKWCNVNVKQTKKNPFFSPFCTSNTTTDFSKSSKSVLLLLLLKTLFLFFSFFTQSAASFSCHPELAVAPYLLYIYISCLSVYIFRIKIQFYSVWERVRELAVFLFGFFEAPCYPLLPFCSSLQTGISKPTYSHFHFFFSEESSFSSFYLPSLKLVFIRLCYCTLTCTYIWIICHWNLVRF